MDILYDDVDACWYVGLPAAHTCAQLPWAFAFYLVFTAVLSTHLKGLIGTYALLMAALRKC